MDSTCGPNNNSYSNLSSYGAHGKRSVITPPFPAVTVPAMFSEQFQPQPSAFDNKVNYNDLYHEQSVYNGGKSVVPRDKPCPQTPSNFGGVNARGIETCNPCCGNTRGNSCGSYQSRENFGLYGHASGPDSAPSTRENYDECTHCVEPGPFTLNSAGNLTPPAGMKCEECKAARKKCPGCDPDNPGVPCTRRYDRGDPPCQS